MKQLNQPSRHQVKPLANHGVRSGFTLMELLLYIAILSIATLFVASTFVALNKGRGKAEARSEVNGNLRFAIERISQDLHAASVVTTPATPGGTTSSTLVLTHPTDGTVTYCVTSGVFYRAKLGAACSGSSDPMTATTVTIVTPTFTRLENTNTVLSKTTTSVQISLSASYNSASSDWQYSQTKQATVALRQLAPGLTASFEKGTNGNTIATGDAGDLSMWDTISIVTGGALVYDNTRAAHGALAAKFATGATSGRVNLLWSTAFGTKTDHYGRAYFYLTANPVTDRRVIEARTNAGAVGCGIVFRTDGKISLVDSTGSYRATSVVAFSLNQWIRVEWRCIHSTTVGQIEGKLFNSADSTTPAETITTTAAWNTLASVDNIRVGQSFPDEANMAAFWMDDIVAGASSYPGPYQ